MSKVIINKTQLPDPDENSLNKIRYRVMGKNRNQYSEWSVIDFIKRSQASTDFQTYQDSYKISSTAGSGLVAASWYTDSVQSQFDIFVRYKFYDTTSFLYRYDALQSLGRTSANTLTIAQKPYVDSYDQCYSVTLMVKKPQYPNIDSTPITITTIEKTSSQLRYTTDRSHLLTPGDLVDLTINNNAIDYSQFAGIRTVMSTPTANTFYVQTGAGTVTSRTPPGTGNQMVKINGNVLFVTGETVFA